MKKHHREYRYTVSAYVRYDFGGMYATQLAAATFQDLKRAVAGFRKRMRDNKYAARIEFSGVRETRTVYLGAKFRSKVFRKVRRK